MSRLISAAVQRLAAALATMSGASIVGFIQAGAGAVKRTVQDKLRERVSAEDFQNNPGTMTQAEYDKAAAAAQAVDGILRFSKPLTVAALNLAKSGLRVECGASVEFTHNGVGVAVSLDGGDGKIFDFHLRGKPLITGHADTTDGVYIRSLHHSTAKFRVRDVVTACRTHFAVCSDFDITCSVNEQPFAIKPTTGLITDERGAGESVQDCTFKLRIEGVAGAGAELSNTNGCEIRGTSEANNKGIVELSNCSRNSYHGFDMESNAVSDIEASGENSSFHDCLALSPVAGNNVELIEARGAKFIGGFMRVVNCQATSADTMFDSVAFSDDPSLGIQGTGSYKNINCREQGPTGATTARIPDRIGEPNQFWTPGFSSSGGGVQGAVNSLTGTHCRIGGMCFPQATMLIAKGSLAPGAVSITGLPFQARETANDYQYIEMGEWENITLGPGYTKLAMRIAPGGTSGTLIKSGDSVPSASVNVADFQDPMSMRFSGDGYQTK